MCVVQLGLACVYCITAGKSMHAVWGYLCTEPCKPFGLSAWIVVFAGLQILLSQVMLQIQVNGAHNFHKASHNLPITHAHL